MTTQKGIAAATTTARMTFAVQFALQLDHLAGNHLPLHGADMVDEQLAVQVVQLVLRAGGPKPVEIAFLRLAVEPGPAHPHLGRADHLGVDVGERQAAFLEDPRGLGQADDLGVDHDQRRGAAVGILAAIHHEHPLQHAQLRRGKAHARRLVHRGQHVGRQRLELGRDPRDRLAALLTQAGVL